MCLSLERLIGIILCDSCMDYCVALGDISLQEKACVQYIITVLRVAVNILHTMYFAPVYIHLHDRNIRHLLFDHMNNALNIIQK